MGCAARACPGRAALTRAFFAGWGFRGPLREEDGALDIAGGRRLNYVRGHNGACRRAVAPDWAMGALLGGPWVAKRATPARRFGDRARFYVAQPGRGLFLDPRGGARLTLGLSFSWRSPVVRFTIPGGNCAPGALVPVPGAGRPGLADLAHRRSGLDGRSGRREDRVAARAARGIDAGAVDRLLGRFRLCPLRNDRAALPARGIERAGGTKV